MNETLKLQLDRLQGFVKKNKYAAMILLAGMVILLFPSTRTSEKKPVSTEVQDPFQQSLEQELKNILEQTNGAGRVEVLLTLDTGPSYFYQEDETAYTRETETELQTETVVLKVDGNETAIPIRTEYPTYRGAVVVAEGADRPAVMYNLMKAVSALTGLNMNQITVIKMKQN